MGRRQRINKRYEAVLTEGPKLILGPNPILTARNLLWPEILFTLINTYPFHVIIQIKFWA